MITSFLWPLQIFSLVRVFFSDGGKLYQWSPVVSYPRAVRANDETRNISVSLGGRAARFVKIQLFFSARWIVISEIRFNSGQQRSIYPVSEVQIHSDQ